MPARKPNAPSTPRPEIISHRAAGIGTTGVATPMTSIGKLLARVGNEFPMLYRHHRHHCGPQTRPRGNKRVSRSVLISIGSRI